MPMKRLYPMNCWLRQTIALLLLGIALTAAAEPQLQRISMATVPTSDLEAFEQRYSRWLGYRVRERGQISKALAESWGAPQLADRRYILMSANGHPEVYVRAVEAPRVPGYVPMTTWGWNGIEIIVDDPVALRETFRGSPFRIIGEPKGLNSYPSIVAFQVVGPDDEVLYLTAETGDRSTSTLPRPNGDVGRVFIMVLAGPDIDALLNWYGKRFSMQHGPARQVPVGVVQRAQGLAADETIGLGLIRLTEHGNLIEFDGYSPSTSGPRPFVAGELPPGIAMTSFVVPDLDALDLPLIAPPARYEGGAYAGRRSAVLRGPTGELVELIEAAR